MGIVRRGLVVFNNAVLLQRMREREALQAMKLKNERLERLCRALQSERTELDRQLKVYTGSVIL